MPLSPAPSFNMLLGLRDRREVCREVFQGLSRAGISWPPMRVAVA
jgi:hypothetical protein